MSIKFTCSCGKRLRARDEMAGKRTPCPRCGMPVGIPFLQGHPGGSLAHMTPAERARHQTRTRSADSELQGHAPTAGRASSGAVLDPAAERKLTLSEELFPQPLDPSL